MWNFWWSFDMLRLCHDFVFGQVKARNTINYFVCILSKILSNINKTFFWFYVLKNHIFDGSPYTDHRALPMVTLVIVKWVIKAKTNLEQNCDAQPSLHQQWIIVTLPMFLRSIVQVAGFEFKHSNINKGIQSNLSIADITYNGQLVIANTFLKNRPNHGKTLIEKLLYSGHLL